MVYKITATFTTDTVSEQEAIQDFWSMLKAEMNWDTMRIVSVESDFLPESTGVKDEDGKEVPEEVLDNDL